MQNKCNCGSRLCSDCQRGFVPVNGNWDFNYRADCGCWQNDGDQQGYARRNRRSNSSCQQCGEYEAAYSSGNDCQCERCGDSRQVECCDENTYVRELEDCACESAYNRNRSGDCGCDGDCGCESCARNRSRRSNNGCDTCSDNASYNRNRSGNCGCKDNDNGTTYARSDKNRHVGMVNVQRQKIDEIFESESGLRAGTLFPELHKPLNGYCPCDSNCSTCAQESAFAAWELRLYLNTHPGDKEALALFRKLRKEAEEINYATTFLEDDCSSGWNWVENPWPWEYDCRSGCDCRSGSDCRCGD